MKAPTKDEIQSKLDLHHHPDIEIIDLTHPGMPTFNSFNGTWAFQLPHHTHVKMVKPNLVLQGESEDGGHPLLRRIDGEIRPLGQIQASAAGHRTAWAATGKGTDLAVDHKIAPLIERLWRQDLPTVFSCQGGTSYRTQYSSLSPGVKFLFRGEQYESAYPFVQTEKEAYLCFSNETSRDKAVAYLRTEQRAEVDRFRFSKTIWGGAILSWLPSDFPGSSLLGFTRSAGEPRPAKFSCPTP